MERSFDQDAFDQEAFDPDAFAFGSPIEPVAVPDVVGLDDAAARAAIEGAGLVPDRVEAFSDSVDAGLVISQVPAAAEEVMPGTIVFFTLSLGEQNTAGSARRHAVGRYRSRFRVDYTT